MPRSDPKRSSDSGSATFGSKTIARISAGARVHLQRRTRGYADGGSRASRSVENEIGDRAMFDAATDGGTGPLSICRLSARCRDNSTFPCRGRHRTRPARSDQP